MPPWSPLPPQDAQRAPRKQRSGFVVLAAAAVLLVGLAGVVNWQESRRAELETQQTRLRSQLAELQQRRALLREVERLAAEPSFYLLLYARTNEGYLRFQDRTLRRFPWTGTAAPGRYTLSAATAEALGWNDLTVASNPAACTAPESSCLLLAPEDFAALARSLKPGAPLVVLP